MSFCFINADYSKLEQQALASSVTEAEFYTFKTHTARAAEMFGVPESQVTPEQRRKAKADAYYKMYGWKLKGAT